ncbi:MAG: protein XcpP [Pseudomonas sp. PGPPP1]|nr:MAG: protein XcpP [Pseudomonas sp. PGPPP1]
MLGTQMRMTIRMSWVRVLILALPLGYALMLAWQERAFHQGLQAPLPTPVPAVPVAVPAPLNILAVATVLGFSSPDARVSSAEPLTLLATVVGTGESRALLAGPAGERFYRAGERLSASSVLRRIEPAHVVLWRQGREELLMLRPAGERFLQVVDAHRKEARSLHLKPTAEQSRK